ncbi:anti-sigma factor family protein [Paenibacillus sp. GCM10027627]|uniref:anti-sigma factor family protein n=1 Tax=unclassified Paenibacillus TaxID=185978 RepID=UPI0036385398
MNCQEVMELMHRELDGDLSEAEIEVLADHTRQCPDCEAMFERMKRLSAELANLPKVVPSYSLVDAIMPELERIDGLEQLNKGEASEKEAPALQPRRAKRNRKWPSWGAVSGVVAAGVVAGLFLVMYPSGLGKNDALQDVAFTADMKNEGPSVADADLLSSKSVGDNPGGDIPAEEAAKKAPALTSGETDNEQKAEVYSNEDNNKVAPTPNNRSEESGATGGASEKPLVGVTVTDQHGDSGTTSNHSGNKGGTDKGTDVDPLPPEQGKVPPGTDMGIMGLQQFISPNGLYIATLDEYVVTITSAESGQLLKETSRKNGVHTGFVWSEDSKSLTYEVHLDQGAIEKYVLQASDWTEKKAAH